MRVFVIYQIPLRMAAKARKQYGSISNVRLVNPATLSPTGVPCCNCAASGHGSISNDHGYDLRTLINTLLLIDRRCVLVIGSLNTMHQLRFVGVVLGERINSHAAKTRSPLSTLGGLTVAPN